MGITRLYFSIYKLTFLFIDCEANIRSFTPSQAFLLYGKKIIIHAVHG